MKLAIPPSVTDRGNGSVYLW